MANIATESAEAAEKKGFWARLNTFKVGFFAGLFIAALGLTGIGHMFFNVFKFGSVSVGGYNFGAVASPTTTNQTDERNPQASDGSTVNQAEIRDSEGTNQIIGEGNTQNQENRQDGVGNVTATSVVINYSSNMDLPGFDRNRGYAQSPPDIGQFNDAILITNVNSGSNFVRFETNEIFVNKRRYRSTFHARPDQSNPTRVSFNLRTPGISADGVLFQFGLKDLPSGSTTLTYLVSIFGDGEILWSNQVKYDESQIASVVLDTHNIEDIVIEYQVVEAGGTSTYYNPLYFTEAKVLKN